MQTEPTATPSGLNRTDALSRRVPRRKRLRSAAILSAMMSGVLLLPLAACGPQYDPLTREGLWQPTHVNRSNLVLMVANPADLTRGTGTTKADGQIAAAAAERLRNDKVKRLPASDISQISTSNSGDNNASSSGP
jgi:hypothetical protein